MNTFLCFTQYFVNKQNVRSFSNIFCNKLLKSENNDKFIQHIFQDDCLVSGITDDLRAILSILRSNLKLHSKLDFKQYFTEENKTRKLCIINKEDVFICCWMALCAIIPSNLFGNNHNNKIFRKYIKAIFYSMKRQYLNISMLFKNWDFTVHPWKDIAITWSFTILQKVLVWIGRYLLASIISLNFYVTTCKVDADENKLHFFWKSQWQSFYDKSISDLVFVKIISRFRPGTKQICRKHNNCDHKKITLKRNVPKLYLILKLNNEYRPIVHYKKDINNLTEKYKMKEKLSFLKALTGPPSERFDTQFESLHSNWIKQMKPKLYFVKSDLTNAFGSINRKKLLQILYERHQQFQREEQLPHIKNKFAKIYLELCTELKKPILIRCGSTIFEWKEGLVQGYKYSPALSELYYSYMDQNIFSRHLTKSDLRLFVRVVDDYLYITDSLDDAYCFLKALSSYRNVNYNKTVVNFEHPKINMTDKITYLGFSYDTVNLNVNRAKNVYVGQMCYKIAFSAAVQNLNKFIDNRIGQSGIQISSQIFNLNYNGEKIIWHHIFTTLCLSANKFCTILAILCDEGEMQKYLLIYKKRVAINLCNAIIETLFKNKCKSSDMIYCINHFRYLSFKALLLCAKQTTKCNILVPHITVQLAKSNCIFGKWREHSSRINSDGTCRSMAIKAICRKQDLRNIMRNFDTLPENFECFNHKRFYR